MSSAHESSLGAVDALAESLDSLDSLASSVLQAHGPTSDGIDLGTATATERKGGKVAATGRRSDSTADRRAGQPSLAPSQPIASTSRGPLSRTTTPESAAPNASLDTSGAATKDEALAACSAWDVEWPASELDGMTEAELKAHGDVMVANMQRDEAETRRLQAASGAFLDALVRHAVRRPS